MNTDSPSLQPRTYPITDSRWKPITEDDFDWLLLCEALAEPGPRLTLDDMLRELDDE